MTFSRISVIDGFEHEFDMIDNELVISNLRQHLTEQNAQETLIITYTLTLL